MKSTIFEQDRRIMNTLSDPASTSLDMMFDEVEFIGRPKVFGTHREYLKIKMKIEKIEVCQIVLPEVPVNERDRNGVCKGSEKCDYKTSDGCCTSFDNNDCPNHDSGC